MEQHRFPSANKRRRRLRIISCLALLGLLSTFTSAQSPSEIPTRSQYTESMLVPASGAPVFVDVPLTAGGAGNSIQVRKSGGNIAVSLLQPNGAEVTSANASQLGYELFESGPSDQASTLSPLDSVMTSNVSVIRFSANSTPGVYRVKAVGQNLSEDGAITVQFSAEAGVQSTIRADATRLQVGSAVALSGFVFENDVPVTGVNAVAHVFREQPPPAGLSVTGWTLAWQQDHGDGQTSSAYRLSISNSGDAVPILYVRGATQQIELQVSQERLAVYGVAAQTTSLTGVELVVGHQTGSSPNFNAIS